MEHDDIAEIGIDSDGRLYVTPTSKTFYGVWREAVEIHWDADLNRLYGAAPRDWSYLDWYRWIVGAVRPGVLLRISPETNWSNVNAELRTEIEKVRATDDMDDHPGKRRVSWKW